MVQAFAERIDQFVIAIGVLLFILKSMFVMRMKMANNYLKKDIAETTRAKKAITILIIRSLFECFVSLLLSSLYLRSSMISFSCCLIRLNCMRAI